MRQLKQALDPLFLLWAPRTCSSGYSGWGDAIDGRVSHSRSCGRLIAGFRKVNFSRGQMKGKVLGFVGEIGEIALRRTQGGEGAGGTKLQDIESMDR